MWGKITLKNEKMNKCKGLISTVPVHSMLL